MSLLYINFFFQAEDGIRDYKVTGVQTCALPIYHRPRRAHVRPSSGRPALGHREPARGHDRGARRRISRGRSEERRVGKECSSRKAAVENRKRKKMKQLRTARKRKDGVEQR